LAGIIILGALLIANDLMYNTVLNGSPLTSLQADYLLLDDSYIALDDDEPVALSDDQRRSVLYRLLIGALLYGLLLAASFMGTGTYMAWIYQRINHDLRMTMIQKVEHLSLQYHTYARTGDAIYRVFQDSATITNVLQQFIITPLRAISWVLFGAFVLTMFSPWLGLLALISAVPMTWFVWKFTPRLRAHARASREASSALTSNIQEAFATIKVTKANQAEESALQEFNHDSTTALDNAYQFRLDILILTTVMAVASFAMLIVAEYFMADWAISEKATYLGGVVTFVGFAAWNLGAFQSATGSFATTSGSAREAVFLWGVCIDLSVGLDRAFYLLELEPGVLERDEPFEFPKAVEQVAWRDVDFAYEKQNILGGLNLTADAGTITAIVGETGSGKSTLMSLLLRLYDPQSGSITVNDVDIRDMALNDLRGNIAIAMQKNVLFTATVRENIGYAVEASDAEIERAAQIACADEFIAAMPQGYLTELGERGSKLSTGQRQRLTIARAIVRDTPILILDEPTAALDAETEHQVLANLRHWGTDRVLMLITHRLSTIRSADQIAFLEDGKIVEIGNHEDLMGIAAGRYRAFVHAESAGASLPPMNEEA
jgi:ABC-type multidrug transport system fused ATPase/permease subunit